MATSPLALVALSAQANTLAYWDPSNLGSSPGSGGNGTWDLNAANTVWAYPGGDFQWFDSDGTSGFDAVFAGAPGSVTLGTTLGATGLYFQTSGYTINGGTNTIFVGGDGVDTSLLNGSVTVGASLSLNTAETFNSAAGAFLTVSGNVSSTNGVLTFTGAGNTTFNGAVSINGGAASNTAVAFNGGGNTTFSGAISGTGGLTLANGSTVVLTGVSGTSTYTGPTIVQAGVLQVGTSGSSLSNILPSGAGVTNFAGLTLGVNGGTAPSTVIFNASQQVSSLSAVGSKSSAVQTITINGSNTTLTVGIPSSSATNSGRGAIVFGSAIASGDVTNVVLNGGGNLVVNAGGTLPFAGAVNFNVGSPTASPNTQDTATVDMRGLNSFVALGAQNGDGNAGIGTMHIGDSNTSSASTNGSTLYLAPTSEFTVGRLDVESGATGATDVLKLGDVNNVIGATNIFVGAGDTLNGRSGGSIVFNSSSGALTLRGGLGGFSNASSSIIDMDSFYTFYNNAISTSGSPSSLFDVSGHQADMQISELSMAFRRGGGVGGATDTFSFGGTNAAGALSNLVAGQIYMGLRFGTVTNSAQNVELATVNLEGGTANIGSIIMANNDSSGLNGTVNAVLNISGGNVSIGTLNMASSAELFPLGTNVVNFTLPLSGVGNATVNISGGAVTLGNGGSITLATASNGATGNGILNITGGSVTVDSDVLRGGLSASENGTLNLTGSTALLDLTGHQIGTASAPIQTLNFQAGTLQNVLEINGGTTPLTKLDNGTNSTTLVLAGTSSYTDGTIINGGILSVSADANLGNASGAVTLNAGASDSSTLLSTGTFTSARTINLNSISNANILDATSGNTLTLTGAIAGSGDLTKGTSGGTVQLAAPGGYNLSGNVNALGGTLAVGGTSVYTSGSNGLVVSSGGLAAPFNVNGALSISGGGKVALNPSVPGGSQTNSVGTLSIGANSALDIGNHTVLVQNVPDETVINSYILNGYNNQFFNGTSASGGALNSVVAANDNSGLTAIGYGNSNDFTFPGSLSPYNGVLTGNQVVIKPALPGDLLLRGTVGPVELGLLLDSYGTTSYDGTHINTWAFGNIDYSADGLVGPADLGLLLNSYGHSASSFVSPAARAAALKMSVHVNSLSAAPAIDNNSIELDVNVMTGDISINGNNATNVSQLVIDSNGSGLVGNTTFSNAFAALFPASGVNGNASINPFNSFTNGSLVNGVTDIGDIYNVSANTEDLTFQFQEKFARSSLVNGTIVYVGVPEPTTLGLMGVAGAGLLARRRRKAKPQE